ncbi:hypothetical protein ACJ73_00500 [Blastomyces percursus]|uniref:Uncharacterized protein n=1 Tax=Blastomyces percursus TaxID=1658174 RepID=A0A1J9RHS3_9EURO|nr:hypothetical protein ACJ73_00500 [Blastomyces percursus]
MAEADGKPAGVELTFADGTSAIEGFLVHNPFTKVQGPFVEQLGIETTALSPALEYKVIAGAISSGCNAAVAASTELSAEKYQQESLV